MRYHRPTTARDGHVAGPGWGTASVVFLALALVVAAPAAAEEKATFDSLAAASSRSDLTSELEALIMRCDDETEDRERRICEEVLRERQAKARQQAILVSIDPPHVTPRGARGWILRLTGCLLCGDPPLLAGKVRRLTAFDPLPVKPAAKGDKGEPGPRFANLAEIVVPEPNETDRPAVESSLKRLRAQAIVKLRAPRTWSQGDVHGIAIETVAWRVLDPCSGKVYVSHPVSVIQLPQTDDPACKAEKKAAAAAPAKAPVVAERLTAADIERALAPVRVHARGCFQRFRVRGLVNLGIDIRPDGTVKMVRSSGSLVDTPSAECVRSAALRVRFPAFQSHTSMHVTFPVLLRQ
jgi:hypothetical protein